MKYRMVCCGFYNTLDEDVGVVEYKVVENFEALSEDEAKKYAEQFVAEKNKAEAGLRRWYNLKSLLRINQEEKTTEII